MNSEAQSIRQSAYDNAVAALHRINPKAVPVARLDEPFAIMRVTQQVRETEPPAPPAPSPERMLIARVLALQNAVAALVAKAKRKGIAVELPADDGGDHGARLQFLNAFHDKLEKQIAYYDATTQEQRAIDDLKRRMTRIEKRLDAIADAMQVLSEFLPHLEVKEAGDGVVV